MRCSGAVGVLSITLTARGARARQRPARQREGVALVVVGHALAHAGEVLEDGDPELLELVGRAVSAELEDLGRVERPAGDDDLLLGEGLADGSLDTGVVTWVAAVEGLAAKILYAESRWSVCSICEQDLGHEGLELDRERMVFRVSEGRLEEDVGPRPVTRWGLVDRQGE